ncbi:MAG: RraA family protein, partial [Bryobacterales bacterium]|nr:RraA family protein [Bryobacterales bacterium]
MLKFSEAWKGDRFPDGRPKVDDKLIERLSGVSVEDVWTILPKAGYNNQFEGGFMVLHP